MNWPSVSVVVPSYNASKTIDSCINSLLSQDYEGKYEIIIVDDGSTDETVKRVKQYPVKLLTQENSGPAKARNRGAQIATGEIVVFTDSDCKLEKSWLANMIKPFINDREIVGVQGRYKTTQKEKIAKFCQAEIEERYEIIKKTGKLQLIGTYSAAYKKNIFIENGGFDETYPVACAEDAAFSFKLIGKGAKFYFSEEAIVFHKHPDTVRKYWKQKLNRGFWRTKLYKTNPTQIVKDNYTPQSLKLQVAMFPVIILSLIAFLLSRNFLYIKIFGVMFIIHLLLSSKLLIKIAKTDKKLLLISIYLTFVRSAAIFYGLIKGIFYNLGLLLKNSDSR